MRWFWQAFPIVQESAAHELWDDDVWHQLATHAVRLARDAGALAVCRWPWSTAPVFTSRRASSPPPPR